eukprot:m.213572 g.213572  ORF g.213572 m.213572 type:complete len:984 (-) comp33153_c0_seq2:157-3108(-)
MEVVNTVAYVGETPQLSKRRRLIATPEVEAAKEYEVPDRDSIITASEDNDMLEDDEEIDNGSESASGGKGDEDDDEDFEEEPQSSGDEDDDDDDFNVKMHTSKDDEVGVTTIRGRRGRNTRARGPPVDAETELAEDVEWGRAPPHTEEYLRRQKNIAMLKQGQVKVERETMLPHLLHLNAAERKCYEPFRAHAQLRSAESVQLLKKKTLGMRSFRTGGRTAFASVVRPLGPDDSGDVDAYKPCEPLILWKPKPKPIEPKPEETANDGAGDDAVTTEGEPPKEGEEKKEGEGEGGDVVAPVSNIVDIEYDEKSVPIEVDNFICHWLRPHQRSGVQFLFDCITGLGDFDGQGCILADDMGLGKTLMSICLIWMALKHGFQGPEGPKICKRIVVCCPTSLVFNWNNEILKWLNGKVKCIAVGNSGSSIKSEITDFASRRPSAPVLIISYETFRNYKADFYRDGVVDMLICDEAHRLKNDATQTSVTLAALKTRKRVLLSGTPLQNRLDEFFAMVNFCNPGVLGSVMQFRKQYERPILAGMEPDCTEKTTEKAKAASAKLSELSNKFILRRTNALLAKHLPTKLIEVVCCKPTPLQVQLYNHFVKSKAVKSAIIAQETDENSKGGTQVLGIIQSLSKLCNHPRLVYPSDYSGGTHGGYGGRRKVKEGAAPSALEQSFKECAHLFPDNFDVRGDSKCFGGGGGGRKAMRGTPNKPTGDGGIMSELSGKMVVLDRLLCEMRRRGNERIVVVSNFTMTLDQITLMCRERMFPCVRLDGSMAVKKRRVLVEDFNDVTKQQFVFLLSSKAGGCGLNLIGANRLVLFDPDWNPATDKQAAARVWRDGQKKRCYVYRFLTSGTIEEKVFQRQLTKEGLQSIVCDDNLTVNAQSKDELRDLFSLKDTLSTTHESLHCKRCEGDPRHCPELKPEEGDLLSWAHHEGVTGVRDKAMAAAAGDDVNFVFSLRYPGQRFEGFRCEDDTDDEDTAETTNK